MEQIVLDVEQRIQKTKKFKEDGFIAGVIYGGNAENTKSVKIQEVSLKKILSKHGSNVKLWVKYGDEKKFGFIKEIQREPLTNKIIHIDVQLVSKDQNIKMQIPIVFKGEEELKANQLQIQAHKSDVEVLGKIDLMPEVVYVDVSKKNAGDTIVFEDFNLDKNIKAHDKEDEIYATITKLIIEEETEDEAEETKTEE
ncbi:large subunit ribosomal protein L25 [Clostridium acidisoli DSM 12555]|jgi:large subunit ribosomal protein L25|uniref:Large subunit ribosomal protein L25 n=1 Tax=Clostridium acidisoli DSM 12555 TaxID=1121291 RepID=A0A1W1XL06_9CLOT|nr:50S ribosomal protein L25 [Clostridium acidisoli]SMC24659.1 large subunit ribosomal protein L25 [Clostridium acidisoli DSM 12555]